MRLRGIETAPHHFLGDSRFDVRAARDNQLPAIAVATGIYSFEQLQQERPALCIRSFEDMLPRA